MEQVCSAQRCVCHQNQWVMGSGRATSVFCAQVAVHMGLSYVRGVGRTNACPWKPFDIGRSAGICAM
eukprot:1918095-Lingulodinium_polyedra.AAC.1